VKWIGQYIWNLVSRFRSDVYLERISTSSETNVLVVDTDGKITKNSSIAGDITAVLAGVGLTGGGTTGAVSLAVGAGTGIDVAEDAISVDVSDFMTNGSDNRIVTATSADAMNAESTLTYDSETLTIGADDNGIATISRATHTDEAGGRLALKGGNATGSNKNGGGIIFNSGSGTGTGIGGSFTFQSHAAGSSGSTSSVNGEVATLDNKGDLSIDGDLTVKGNDIKDDDGTTCITFDSSGNTSVAGTLSCADIDITGATNALTVNPQTGNVAISCISTDADCHVRVQDNGTAGTNLMSMVATSDDLIMRNDEGNFKVKMANNATTTLDLDQDGDLSITGNILPGITSVKILPHNFIADDGGRPAAIDDTGSDRFLESFSTNKLYASVDIPLGFKATHVHIHGSATSAMTVYEADVNSKSVTSKGTGNIGTNLNITDVTADATNYILIQLAQASGEEVFGGVMTIAKV
tara:strand:- start:2704 stop:4104 length:1401 start_codon:yes stop_codon:yes gene_type:complete